MNKISRRQALKLMGLTAAGTILAACTTATTAPTTAPVSPTDTSAAPAATTAPVATTAPTSTTAVATPTKSPPLAMTFVEAWFGVPQFQDSVDPVMLAISQKMQDEGVNIQLKAMILDNYDTKYPLLYSSGADFTFAYDAPWYKMTTLINQNALAPLEDLIKQYGPNLAAEITPKILNFNYTKGHVYGIPAAYYYAGTPGAIIREDLLEKYNVAAPSSAGGWPSLEPFLKALHDNDSSLIPFGNVYTQPVGIFEGKNGWAFGLSNIGMGVEDIMNGTTITNLEDQTATVDSATLVRDWFEKGYIPQQDLSLSGATQTVVNDYFIPGKVGSYAENEPNYKYYAYNQQLQATLPTAQAKGYELTGEMAGKWKGLGALTQWNFEVFNASASQEQQVAGIQYFDWLTTSQDNMDLWLMGIDGVNYKKETGLGFSAIPGVDATRNYSLQWYVSGIGGRFQRQPSDLPQDCIDALTFFTTESNWDFNPYEAFQVDTSSIQTDMAALAAVYDEAEHGLYSGQTAVVADSVAKMKSSLDGAGRQTLMGKLQAQFDAWRAANPTT